jgi:hypothetical protein
LPFNHEGAEFIEIANELLKMKYYNRYLEHPEGQGSIDNETSMRLVKRATNDKISNREFL